MSKNTNIKELKMEIAILKEECIRLRRITKDTLRQSGLLEWEKME